MLVAGRLDSLAMPDLVQRVHVVRQGASSNPHRERSEPSGI